MPSRGHQARVLTTPPLPPVMRPQLRRRTTGGKGKQGKQGGSKRQTASAAAAAEPAPREAGQEPRSPAQEVAAA